MPIVVLPEATSRALGSSLVLNDARSVVKELVDNALDARASAISIEISANTLDIIQVKDNGTGIGVEDRQLLCRRGCTSKIRSMDDLGRLGGTFLGFRGEALASMAELSRAVLVTTRVDGEVVATSLEYGASGMLSSSSASHPVGTTIRIQNFLSNIPVRKQTALKNPARTLQALRATLFQFAFARPDVRFSFKVLKGKNDKMNWTYAPSSSDSLLEICAKIVGKDMASQCTTVSISSADPHIEMEDGWQIDALIISANADTEKVRSGNQYISIDGRPVSPERSTMKEIAMTYRRYLLRTLNPSALSPVSRPFLVMRIRCPPESYDVNIEPAKDEVLFFQPALLFSLVESLLRRAYGNIDNETNTRQRCGRNSEVESDVYGNTSEVDQHGLEFSENLKQRDQGHTDSDEAEETVDRNQAFLNPFSIAAMNAIVATKKMEPAKWSTSSDAGSVVTPAHGLKESSCELRRVVASSHRTPVGPQTHLPSPGASGSSPVAYQHPAPPMRRPAKPTTPARDEETGSTNEEHDVNVVQPRTTSLQAWLTPVSELRHPWRDAASKLGRPVDCSFDDLRVDPPTTSIEPQRRPIPSTMGSSGGLTWGAGQKPFKSPLKSIRHGQPPRVAPSKVHPRPPDQAHQQNTQDTYVTSEQGEEDDWDYESDGRHSRRSSIGQAVSLASNSELSDIMDFEHRKKAAIAHQRRVAANSLSATPKDSPSTRRHSSGFTPSSVQSGYDDRSRNEDYAARSGSVEAPPQNAARSNPHKNRYQAALKTLSHSHPHVLLAGADEIHSPCDSPIPDSEAEDEGLSRDDPRAYLIEQRRKSGQSKPHRTKSSRLPLESTPSDATTLHLVLTTRAFEDMTALAKQLQVLAACDHYVMHGEIKIEDPDLFKIPLSNDLQSKLREIVKTKFRIKAEDGRALVPHLKVESSSQLSSSLFPPADLQPHSH